MSNIKDYGDLIKGTVRSWFRTDCGSCFMVNKCISATGITRSKFEYVLKARGWRVRVTEKMMKGRQRHEDYLFPYKTVKEYGINQLDKDIYDGKEIFLSEVRICSRFYGLRGRIDLLKIHLTKNSFFAHIVELKSSYFKTDILQLMVYGLILSDPEFEFSYKKDKKIIGTKILPKLPLNMNIKLELRIFGKEKGYVRWWMVKNELTDWAKGRSLALQKRLKMYRKLHKYSIYLISDYDKSKSKQRFLGRRRPTIKTRPKVRK